MRRSLAFLFQSAFVSSSLAGCAADPAPDASSGREERLTSARSNCSFIPGCKELLEASDGPMSASLLTFDDGAGGEERRLTVTYREAPGAELLLCRLFPRQPPLSFVFVTGPQDARVAVRGGAPAMCPSSWGDNPGLTSSATFSLAEHEDPDLWDMLFPRNADGDRWYALRVAAVNAHGVWDSRFGQDYRLVLRPR